MSRRESDNSHVSTETAVNMRAWGRKQLSELRATVRAGTLHTLPRFETDCFAPGDDVSESAVAFALSVTEARERYSGIWATETFETRARMVAVWRARMMAAGVGAEGIAACRAYESWIARIETEAVPRASEMLSRLAFWVSVSELHPGEEGLCLARRAADISTTPVEEAVALTQVGFALSLLERRGEAERVLAWVMEHAPDGPTRWQAQYHHAYLAQRNGNQELVIGRYMALFYALSDSGGLATDLGWTVATDLVGLLVAAKDGRVNEVQARYRLALATEGKV